MRRYNSCLGDRNPVGMVNTAAAAAAARKRNEAKRKKLVRRRHASLTIRDHSKKERPLILARACRRRKRSKSRGKKTSPQPPKNTV